MKSAWVWLTITDEAVLINAGGTVDPPQIIKAYPELLEVYNKLGKNYAPMERGNAILKWCNKNKYKKCGKSIEMFLFKEKRNG